jgi:Protein of unknown function (DUF1572).
MSADELAAVVCLEAVLELERAAGTIRHCMEQLSEEQVWRRKEGMNSVGNLMLHLAGNIRQYFVSGVGGAADVRERPTEFSEQGPIPKKQLMGRLEAAVNESVAALARAKTAAELVRVRRIQSSEMTALGAIFRSLPHFRGHTQEIIHMTREMVGDAYRFAWTPPEGKAK